MTWLERTRAALHSHSHLRKFVEGSAVALLAGAVAALAGRTDTVERFEASTLDFRFDHYADRAAPDPRILVLEITDRDLEDFAEYQKVRWPWDREAYALAVNWLHRAGARAVFLDLSFQDQHAGRPEKDAKLAAAIRNAGNVYLLATFDTATQRAPDRIPALLERAAGDAPPWMRPSAFATAPLHFPDAEPPWSYVTAARGILTPMYGKEEKDPDGKARRYPAGIAFRGKAFLSPGVALAADILGQPAVLQPGGFAIGDRAFRVEKGGLFIPDWTSRRAEFNPKGISLGNVITNEIARLQKKTPQVVLDPADFKDRIVFIGASAEGLFDLKVTPLGTQLGVEIHATAADTILRNAAVRRAPRAVSVLGAFGLALVAGVASLRLRIRTGLPLAALLGAGWVALAWHLLGRHHLWLDAVSPLGALGLSALGAALVNYAVEGRQKRDIRAKFGTYLTPEYVRMLEENPDLFKLGGEERTGTAFFSDLSGFTAMSEKMTPAELVARMNEYLTLMTNSIKRFRGTVDKYEGDAIVAFWNAPIEQKDHAVLACRAALDNQRELAGLRERWIKAYGVTVVARIGINTGKMIFGNMGSDDKFNYTMMGDPVNLAARLESANKDYGTYLMIGQDTHELVKDAMECRELDLIKVKGKQIPVTVYELLCEKGRLDARKKECLDRYNLGLQAYRMKQFHAAEQRFLEALEIDPEDSPSKLYVERSRALVAKPPEPGWTYIYEKKDK